MEIHLDIFKMCKYFVKFLNESNNKVLALQIFQSKRRCRETKTVVYSHLYGRLLWRIAKIGCRMPHRVGKGAIAS